MDTRQLRYFVAVCEFRNLSHAADHCNTAASALSHHIASLEAELYGPYFEDDIETAPSNIAFDESLRSRNPAWGLRRLSAVDLLAAQSGFERRARYEMPANNLTIVYRKAG